VQRRKDELEVARLQELARIEAEKFSHTIEAIGADTIKSIAQAGPEMQVPPRPPLIAFLRGGMPSLLQTCVAGASLSRWQAPSAHPPPPQQAKLLGGLGLSSVLITDGNSPINLFNTAKGLMGQAGADALPGAE